MNQWVSVFMTGPRGSFSLGHAPQTEPLRAGQEIDLQADVRGPDDRRIAYFARQGDKWSASIDGVLGPPYDLVGQLAFTSER